MSYMIYDLCGVVAPPPPSTPYPYFRELDNHAGKLFTSLEISPFPIVLIYKSNRPHLLKLK